MHTPRSLIRVCALAWAVVLAAVPAAAMPGLEPARKAAREGYIFLYPLVMNYRLMYLQAIDESSPSFSGGFGQWKHYGAASLDLRVYPSPSVDTLCSAAWVDLRSEPWVLTIPPSDNGRFVASQWDDLWGFVLDSPGVILDGDKGGSFLLAPPGWKGVLPKGVTRVIKGETPFLGTLARTEALSPADLPAADSLRQRFTLARLSAFLHCQPPAPAPGVSWPAWKEGSEKTPDFFSYACFLLSFTAVHPQDRGMLRRLREIGVSPGAPWRPDRRGRAFRKAIQDGINDARAGLAKAAAKTSWSNKLFSNRQTIRDDYLSRCLGAFTHLFGPVPSQTASLTLYRDLRGESLDGSARSYTITFPAGGTPPGRYFWSVTAYSLPDRALVPAGPPRPSVGTHSLKLVKGADGSITLYLRKSSPGKGRELNWIPVPEGPFSVVIRSCGPDRRVIFHTWRHPEVKRDD